MTSDPRPSTLDPRPATCDPPQAPLLLGAHMSISGGIEKAVGRGVGCTALQIFTKNASQWKAKPLGEEDIGRFKAAVAASPIAAEAVVAHDSYLINLASPDPARRQQSLEAFTEELRRCDQLGIPYLVTHPG